jgi:hypothetical protein
MTDDQTPGVAAMGERENLARVVIGIPDECWDSWKSDKKNDHEYRRGIATADLIKNNGYRLAAGPTLAEVLAAC